MSDNKLERISALMDGELSSQERELAIDYVKDDLEVKQNWQRYHIIGDTMRNTLPSMVQPDLAEKLNKMLENEPAILAPKSTVNSNKKIASKDFTKPFIGLAIAASVTAVAIFGIQNTEQQTPSVDGSAPQVVSNEGGSLSNLEQSLATAIPKTVRTVKYEPVENTIEATRLNSYILNHNQFNSRMGVQGVSPNARLVGHESQR